MNTTTISAFRKIYLIFYEVSQNAIAVRLVQVITYDDCIIYEFLTIYMDKSI